MNRTNLFSIFSIMILAIVVTSCEKPQSVEQSVNDAANSMVDSLAATAQQAQQEVAKMEIPVPEPIAVAEIPVAEVPSVPAAEVTPPAVQGQANTAQEAIDQSKTMGTPEEQTQYLATQALGFLSAQKADQATSIAQHILTNIDPNSASAKNILEKVKDAAGAAVQNIVGGAQNKIGDAIGGMMKQ